MFFSAIKAAVAALALLGNPALAEKLGKPVLFKDGLSSHVNGPFLANMPSTPSTSGPWTWGWIPKRCFEEAGRYEPKLSPYDFEVFNVQYNDCSAAWIMCRHVKAGLSKSQMIDLFGRLPVRERQTVAYVMATPGAGSAYMAGGTVVFQGNTASISVFQHEVGHAVDAYWGIDGPNKGTTSSRTQAFLDAIEKDTCVPDDYSNSSNVEDYTQVSVLLLFQTVVPGGLGSIGADWSCMVRQLLFVASRQQDAMNLGGTCTWRHAYGEVVSMGPASGNNKRDIGPMPVMDLVPGHPLAVVLDVNIESEVTVYKDLVFNETEDALAAERQAGWEAAAKRRAINRIF